MTHDSHVQPCISARVQRAPDRGRNPSWIISEGASAQPGQEDNGVPIHCAMHHRREQGGFVCCIEHQAGESSPTRGISHSVICDWKRRAVRLRNCVARVSVGDLDVPVQPDAQTQHDLVALRFTEWFQFRVNGCQPFIGNEAVPVLHLPQSALDIAERRTDIAQAVNLAVGALPWMSMYRSEIVPVDGAGASRDGASRSLVWQTKFQTSSGDPLFDAHPRAKVSVAVEWIDKVA
jgi:hypothetical protein